MARRTSSRKRTREQTYDVAIVGGAGHVGLPLALTFADKGKGVLLYDINEKSLRAIQSGVTPFIEYGAEPILKKVLGGNLFLTRDARKLAKASSVVIAIGTPVDEYLNPKTRQFLQTIEQLQPFLSPDQLIVIRSTVYPHTCEQVFHLLSRDDQKWHVAYCPERTIQGYAIKELPILPQIVAGLTPEAQKRAVKLFRTITAEVIETSVPEAELVKLFTNAWRYIQFAVTNQFFVMAQTLGVDYNRVRRAMTQSYGRAATLPTAGFAAGPCLLKDTMQLSAFHSNNFLLGHAAMMINEGLPNFLVEHLRRRYDLGKTTVGILGMAFKADIDDIRDSLSYKLGKILRFHRANVLYSDEFAKDPTFTSKEEVVKRAAIIIVGVPHSAYKMLEVSPEKEVVDLWGVVKGGKRIL